MAVASLAGDTVMLENRRVFRGDVRFLSSQLVVQVSVSHDPYLLVVNHQVQVELGVPAIALVGAGLVADYLILPRFDSL